MGVTISRYGRFWAVYEGKDDLVCLCVYRKGAVEVSKRLGVPHPTLPQRTKTQGMETTEERKNEDGSPRNDFADRRRDLRVGESGAKG